MSAVLLEGKAVAERILRETRERSAALLSSRGLVPRLVMVRVAGSDASNVYARRLAEACASVGIRFSEDRVPIESGEEGVLAALSRLNRDAMVHGILVEIPLPPAVSLANVRAAILPAKDVERINPTNQGLLLYGAVLQAPCTAMAVMEVLLSAEVPLEGREAVVVGASHIVGRPLVLLLLERLATVTVCHVATRDLAFHTRRAQILVSAVGKAGLVRGEMIQPGAVVVDVGVNRVRDASGRSRIVGDVDFDSVREVAGCLTPVPGGVGPVTTAVALRNEVLSAEGQVRAC